MVGRSAPPIEVRGLRKSYGNRLVLDGVDLEVRAGEVCCLLGPNGAGKTTTVEILEGYREATSGGVRVLGFEPSGQPRQLRDRIGVVLQECAFPRYARVSELIDAYGRYFTKPRPRMDVLDVVDLSAEEGMLVRRLSGGQRRRLDLALALVGDPELVFLDEPTTGFDPEARHRCWHAIENLRALGTTVLLTTHYLDEAERLADRVAILFGGRITACGAPADLARRAQAPTRITFTVPDTVGTGQGGLPGRLNTHIDGGRITVTTDTPTSTLRSLFAWAAQHQLGELDGLTVTPPSLEETYLRHVSLQDAE